MILRRSFQQLFHRPKLVMIYGLLLCILTAMLSVGSLLMRSSVELAQQTEDAYRTIGIVEYYRDVLTSGNYYSMKAKLEQGLISPEEYLQKQDEFDQLGLSKDPSNPYRFPLQNGTITWKDEETQELPDQVETYDLAPLVDSPYVTDYENRARYGVYNPEIESSTTRDIHTALKNYDVLIFTYTGDETLVLDYDFCKTKEEGSRHAIRDIPVKIRSSYLAERYGMDNFMEETTLPIAFEVERGQTLGTLEPGKTYITVSGVYPSMREWKQFEDRASMKSRVSMPTYFDGLYRSHQFFSDGTWKDSAGEITSHDPGLFCEYTDDFWDTDQGKRFSSVLHTLDVNYHSAAAMTTKDLTLLQAFHNEELYARQGRLFSEDEYLDGSPVCLVSYDMAQTVGWQVGDQVELSFYECDTFTSYDKAKIYTNNFIPIYQGDGFFTTQTYEIIGLYDGPALATGGNLELKYDEEGNVIDPDLPPYLLTTNLIFVPEGSVHNTPLTRPASFLTTTIQVQNGTPDLYLNDLSEKGLLAEDANGVRVKITFYDQGYYQAAGLAESTGAAARTIIALALATAVVCVVLFSYLYVSRRRNEIAIMRAMGISASRIGSALLLCLVTIAIIAIALGCALGIAAVDLTEDLFLQDDTARLNTLFSSTYGDGINKTADLSLQLTWQPFAFAAAVTFSLILAAASLMLFMELRKSPMMLLSKKGERS